MRRPKSRCIECYLRQSRRRAKDKRAAGVSQRQALSPEGLAVYRDQHRQAQRARRGTTPDRYRACPTLPPPLSQGYGPMVPLAPFAEFLAARIRTDGLMAVARVVGWDEARVRLLAGQGQASIGLDLVDHAAVALGDPGLLAGAYPN